MSRSLTPAGRMVIAGAFCLAAALATCTLIMTPSRFGFGADAMPPIPDPALTPGAIASSDPAVVCARQSYSRQHRQTTYAMKVAVYRRYGIVRAGRDFEVDHRVPLALGGADTLANLWPQEGWFSPSYHDKDRLETRVWLMVCRERTMTLTEGQALFLAPDWREGYRQLFGKFP